VSFANGVSFLRWTSELLGRFEPAQCLLHPAEGAAALDELLDRSVSPTLMQLMLETQEGNASGRCPTVLVDLSSRPDVIDLVRVARLESGGRTSERYRWHGVRRGCVRFVVLDLEFRSPARAEVAIAFPLVTDEVQQVLGAAASVGWLTIANTSGEFSMLMAPVTQGLSECLLAVVEPTS